MTGSPTSIPAKAGTDQWPVISAVRYGTGTHPVEYIAIVDCGQGTPTHPYATVHLYLWPDGIKTRDGHYNLTVRREALVFRTEVRDLRRRAVAAVW